MIILTCFNMNDNIYLSSPYSAFVTLVEQGTKCGYHEETGILYVGQDRFVYPYSEYLNVLNYMDYKELDYIEYYDEYQKYMEKLYPDAPVICSIDDRSQNHDFNAPQKTVTSPNGLRVQIFRQ